ncbi:hypothetical protein Maq22A_c18180 [Methylobacterium aquaticum]|uniref:Uncharacterized protein n=1 Tax=Methylobacterium aquaticum TaxID=270351 RepID=A0A0C6FNA7_9HYPH|nr:hypothetical protein Maq22A_c18180 [Methylobacterium aquaticum]
MLVADDRPPSIVVDQGPFGSVVQHDGKAGGQADADGGAQRLRPRLDRAERRLRPVHRAHERPHLATAGHEAGIDRLSWHIERDAGLLQKGAQAGVLREEVAIAPLAACEREEGVGHEFLYDAVGPAGSAVVPRKPNETKAGFDVWPRMFQPRRLLL